MPGIWGTLFHKRWSVSSVILIIRKIVLSLLHIYRYQIKFLVAHFQEAIRIDFYFQINMKFPLIALCYIIWKSSAMGLLPDKQYCGCACAGNAGNAFPVTAGKRSRHASRHVRHARAVMHAGIANLRFPLKSAAGENVPGIPGACATCNFTYLVRGPCTITHHTEHCTSDRIEKYKW